MVVRENGVWKGNFIKYGGSLSHLN